VSGQPQLPDRLQVIARGRGTRKAVQPFREEVVVRVSKRRRRREDACADVERYDEEDKARAAETSSSKSGTSAFS
jgi:hypothetical protein